MLQSPGLIKKSRPIPTKMIPATRRIHTGETVRATTSPAATAMADEATSASAEPANTIQRERELAASESAASCVLSPSSATKMAAKVEKNSL